jgi:hypothetical protein
VETSRQSATTWRRQRAVVVGTWEWPWHVGGRLGVLTSRGKQYLLPPSGQFYFIRSSLMTTSTGWQMIALLPN